MPQRRPDDPIIFLVDECLGKGVVRALRKAGRHAEWSRDHYPEGTDDEEWIPKVAERGWVILSKDERIQSRPHEVHAVKASGAALFVLRARNMNGDAMVAAYLAALSKIEKYASSRRRPFIYRVSRDGKLEPRLGGDRRGSRR